MHEKIKQSTSEIFASALLAVIAAGCTVGPDYQRPAMQTPSGWAGPTTAPAGVPATQASSTPAEPVVSTQWWTKFSDPTLNDLVIAAAQSNLDLQQAESRIRQARASRGVASADLWPRLDASGSYARTRTAGAPQSRDNYQAGFDASWEIDVFGGTRRNVEAADAGIAFAIEDRRDVLVTLTSEVARNYIELRGFQQRIAIANNNLVAQRRSTDLTQRRFAGGLVSALDVANAEAQVANTLSQIPSLEAAGRQSMYALSVLLGREPGALTAWLEEGSRIPTTPPAIPIGLPSDLLLRRPDLRRAEAQLHAETARVGVAVSDLYPRFSLTGSLGTQGTRPKDLGNWDNRFWSIGPSVSWPIFNAGQIRSNIAIQRAVQEQTLLAYQQTYLTALQDVENALIAYAKEQQRRENLKQAVAAFQRAVDLATQLYTLGQTDFLNVLAAQQSLYNAQDALVQSDQAVATNLVSLYKALGGGWTE